MALNQSISENPAFTTPKIDGTERQGTLPVGPTGRVHRGGKSALPDNKAFWESVNAVEFSGRGVTRQEVYRAVAWFVALTEKRLCFAAVETIAEQARLGTTATRAHLRALERDGYIETKGDRSKGRSTTCYRLTKMAKEQRTNPTLNVANPTLSDFNPTLSVAKEVIEEGTEEVQEVRTLSKLSESPLKLAKTGRSKLRSSPHSAQERMICAIAVKLDLPALLNAAGLESFDGLENTEKQALIKRMLKAESWHDRRAAQRRDAATNVPPTAKTPNETGGKAKTAETNVPRPDPPPMTPELRAEIEADVRGRGWHRVAGTWMKLS